MSDDVITEKFSEVDESVNADSIFDPIDFGEGENEGFFDEPLDI